jgi:hypothetical protein
MIHLTYKGFLYHLLLDLESTNLSQHMPKFINVVALSFDLSCFVVSCPLSLRWVGRLGGRECLSTLEKAWLCTSCLLSRFVMQDRQRSIATDRCINVAALSFSFFLFLFLFVSGCLIF